MRAETLAGAMGVAGLLLSAVVTLHPASPPAPRETAELRHPFPPAPRHRGLATGSRGDVSAMPGLDREVARLGRSPSRLDGLRRAFLDSSNLMQFAMDRLPRAAAGDGASAYYLYLALDQCRSFLRGDATAANASFERVLSLADLTDEERVAWQSDFERCRGFTVADWSALGDALGEDRPGAEIEWASVWFERAAQAGYAPALVEQALRPSPYSALERAAMLHDAFPSAGAEAYWLLFAHSGEVDGGDVGAPALAWLIVACRAGQDCSEEARWYRGVACMQGRCEPGQTALEHYWQSATLGEREEAWVEAARIEALLRARVWDDLPVPDLEVLDSNRLWGRGY